MTRWPRQHLILFGLTVAGLAVLMAIHLVLVRPLASKVRADRNYIAATRNTLNKGGWPLDPERLGSLLEMKRLELEGTGKGGKTARDVTGMRNKSRLLLREATSTFKDRIQRYFEHTSDFVRDISRLDFQDEYNNLDQKLSGRNIFLAADVLRLGEKTTSPHTYQLVLQVWTVDRLAELALNAGLQFQQVENVVVEDERGAGRRPARIQVQPVRAYASPTGEPYLFEFPVRLGLTGTPDQVFQFLTSLHGENTFLPVARMEITALPGFRDDQRETAMGIAALAIDVECSSFFQLIDDIADQPVRPKSTIRILPSGA
jgi:hypothetical protein